MVQVSRTPRGRLSDAGRCLASEKRSSGKSRGWAWWIGCDYGDLGSAVALDLTVQLGARGLFGELEHEVCGLLADLGRVPSVPQLLPLRYLDLRMTVGPQAM